jgi:SAM-dependent methyltransferase
MIRSDHLLIFWHWLRGVRARRRARRLGLPGLEIDRYGRGLGWRMCRRGMSGGLRLALQPVDFLRYYEFAFVAEAVRGLAGPALDVSSPALLSLYLAATQPGLRIRISNPDARDSSAIAAKVKRLGLPGIEVAGLDVQALAAEKKRYQAIWSISVFEHIAGPDEDGRALRALADCLRPGGRLCLTVMSAPGYEEEFVGENTYELGIAPTARGYFFQRYYDEAAVRRRLLAFVPELVVRRLAWLGEKEAGTYAAFVERARRHGYSYAWAVDAPWVAANSYRWFDRFADMPGVGVCCLELHRPT